MCLKSRPLYICQDDPLAVQHLTVVSNHEGENLTWLNSVEILLVTSGMQNFTQFLKCNFTKLQF